ncbi:glycosyltransferase family 2 protein [Lichenifustis flavocetrariae]|uniref:Glycosyltransferase family 2 protein n=1 Tax=Lichenifustis flavocetrariae TaxID=2949735 RepID=A0AA41Z2B6_9HYPH|nr:glycosyltransferase family 2 protein [Lichenifustis flavocetrariae]MCW6512929.1 glycosyltransferase family 2 protein [Lichenifustis flavocetrariae]
MARDGLRVSVVVPVRNEASNIEPLLKEIERALLPMGEFEVIYVDDGSDDLTSDELQRLSSVCPWLSYRRHEFSTGQSAAIRTGVKTARASTIVTMDGDGQNDPAFIPSMVEMLERTGAICGLVQAQREGRQDTGFKKLQSRIANNIRQFILSDGTRDTGCGLKCFPRSVYLDLPFFAGLHRFMPALVQRDGYTVRFTEVRDRTRLAGLSKYGLFDRLGVGIVDLLGVWWLLHRSRRSPVRVDSRDHVDHPRLDTRMMQDFA